MKKFEEPIVKVLEFAVEDVVTTSVPGEEEEEEFTFIPPCL